MKACKCKLIGGSHFCGYLCYRTNREFDKSNPYIKFGGNKVINHYGRLSTKADRRGAILTAILCIVRLSKLVFELEQEYDGSNPYMKFGRNPIKNDYVRVTTTADTDRRWPFCQPSWLSFVRQNPYSNLNESLRKAIHYEI